LNDAFSRSIDIGGTTNWTERGGGSIKVDNSISVSTHVTVSNCQISFTQRGNSFSTHTTDDPDYIRTEEDQYAMTATLSLLDIAPAKIQLAEGNRVGFFTIQPSNRPSYSAILLGTVGDKVHYSFDVSPHVAKRNGDVVGTYRGFVLGKTDDEDGMSIPLKDKAMAPRLIKAIHDLSVVCGAKEVNPNLY
jgi:hypothetical protein